jgi:LL-diaminopimelate aminotransferase
MYAKRVKLLPSYLFVELDKKKERAVKNGADIIDLGEGNPDQSTPEHIVSALCEAASDPSNHGYPSYEGMFSFRKAVADWYANKGVSLDPEKEVLTLIGSKEGIAHIPLAFLNDGDLALVPDPAYPVYKNATILADGVPYVMPLREENDFKPDLSSIDDEIAKEAKLLFINYPNNPTAAVVDKRFFQQTVDFAEDLDIIVCHDFAYSEIVYDGYKAPNFLSVRNAKEVGIEFNSLSKTYNMAGWRIGFAVGNEEILEGLRKIKTNVDSGLFQAVQHAGIAALGGTQDSVFRMRAIYKERRDVLVDGLEELGLDAKRPKATFYVWMRIPAGYDSLEFSELLLEKAGVVVTPGVGFGDFGEGFVRFSLTENVERIREAVERMRGIEFRSMC